MKKYFALVSLCLIVFPFVTFAQMKEQSGWLASFNSLKLSEKWGLHFDVQLRSADDLDYVRNLLVRPGVTYFFNEQQNLTAGYALIHTFANPDVSGSSTLSEHRIWEQYILSYKIKSLPVTHRFRLEQRFIERPANDVFSQRIRYFVRTVIPFGPKQDSFTKGPFAGLQNELFLNLQNKDELNGKVFDQNRAYASIGYRLNKKVDVEAGYLNQYVEGTGTDVMNHVAQLALYCRF